MTVKKQLNMLLTHWNKIKQQVGLYADQKKLKEVQTTVQSYIKRTEKDLGLLLHGDIKKFKARLRAEKRQLEKLIDKAFSIEIKRAKKFVEDSKNELCKLQKKLEQYVHLNKKTTKTAKTTKKKPSQMLKKTTLKKATKKKVAKKK